MRLSLLANSFGSPDALVTSGPFRVSRNPIYVAFLAPIASLALFSAAVALAVACTTQAPNPSTPSAAGPAPPRRARRERDCRDCDREIRARGRAQLATDHLMEHLGALLDGEREPYRALFEPALERVRADQAELALCARDELVHLSWTIWTAPRARGRAVAPGRHALFGRSAADRQLVVAPSAEGARYRLVIGTRSWFDLESRPPLPRPDLAALAARLNELEKSAPSDAAAWRAEDPHDPSPELWFGGEEFERFSEHNAALAPSSLEPGIVRREVADALRAVASLP